MKNGQTVLRKIKSSDLVDYEKWLNVETEWMDWDAPWESLNEDEAQTIIEYLKSKIDDNAPVLYRMEIDDLNGNHIGWVSSYEIYYGFHLAIGIDIPPISARGKGHGFRALKLFIDYLFEKTDKTVLYAQTWSGNTKMIRLAQKLGFVLFECKKNFREVNGKLYDALTFVLEKDDIVTQKIDDVDELQLIDQEIE